MSRPSRRNILLLDSDLSRAETIGRLLERQFEALDTHYLEAPDEADLYLETARFDAIVARYTPDISDWLNRQVGQGYATLALIEAQESANGRLSDGVDRCPCQETPAATCGHIAQRLRQRWDALPTDESSLAATDEHFDRVLDAVDSAASRLKHDINNPLSIIAGNAQLLLELASTHHLDGEVVQVARDIQAAAARASEMAGELKQLRHQVARDALDEETTLAEEPADGR